MIKSSLPYRFARSIYRFLKQRIFYGLFLLPYGRRKHRELLATSDRKNDHTYTSFYRSPVQLALLTGPVLDYLQPHKGKPLTINVFASSNGAEAYTIASALLAAHPHLDFHLYASDLHQSMVDKAKSATYSLQEITQGLDVSNEFMEQTFDKIDNELYRVKESIQNRITFSQADLLSDTLTQQFSRSDIVFAQNVLFHMPPDMARKAFKNIIHFLDTKSVLFIDGMEIDMRGELIKETGLLPLTTNIRKVYEYSRMHISDDWWNHYWGNEPYFPLARDKNYRYGTIFLKSN